MLRGRLVTSSVLSMLVACSGPPMPSDAGAPDAAGDTGAVVTCTRAAECGDTTRFCERWQCEPGSPEADARGCVALGSPCADGETCDETGRRCVGSEWCTEGRAGCALPGDCDGDGELAMACGGNDCDDADASRYPGNPEVCDAEGHDEDCDPSTVGDTDVDGDGYVAAACCNGVVCGPDCDDADFNRNPGAAEICDGADNDCTGGVDDAGGLCPGGTCTFGRCDFDGWDRTFGSAAEDRADGVVIDESGNIYVVGTVGGDTNFGEGPVMDLDDTVGAMYVISYRPDRVRRWVYVASGIDVFEGPRVAVGGGVVGIVGKPSVSAMHDFGSGASNRSFLLLLDASTGAVRSDVRPPWGATFTSVAPTSGGFVVAGYLNRGGADLGGGVTPVGERSGLVVHYDISGAYVREQILEPVRNSGSPLTTMIELTDVEVAADGTVVVAGGLQGRVVVAGEEHSGRVLVASLGPDLSERWGFALGGGGTSPRVGVTDSGAVYLATNFFDSIVVDGTMYSQSGPNPDGILVGLSSSGAPITVRHFEGASIKDVAGDGLDFVHVVGELDGVTDFGGGGIMPPDGRRSGYLASYDAAGMLVSETPYGAAGVAYVSGVATGPGGSRAVVGDFGISITLSTVRVAAGGLDVFVLRLGS